MTLPFDLRSIDRTSLFASPTMDGNAFKSSSSSDTDSTSTKAQHFCLIIHGLWGNSKHLDYVAKALQEQHGEDELLVYSAKRNTGSLTYDGIEIGAERVTKETVEVLEQLTRDGHSITKFSVVGYSLGGLVARYVVGLLWHKGLFDKIQPINFTTFATPHLGVRTPLLGNMNHVWNVAGARLLSTSGRQLFTIDDFRDTGRPLLSVLADPESIFIRALSLFKHRVLYSNIVNDRTTVFYTAGISRCDPYTNFEKISMNYVKGYEPVILDPVQPVERAPDQGLPTFYQRVQNGGRTFVQKAPIYLGLSILLPIVFSIFIVNSAYQTIRSRQRIQLHESDSEGQGFGVFRVPYLVQDIRLGLEETFETANSAQTQDYLLDGSEEMVGEPTSPSLAKQKTTETIVSEKSSETSGRLPEFPTLALTPAQFSMISALDKVGFRKYPVHITKSSHSHAAIIVRSARAAFEEGKVVVKHWLNEEFEV